MNQVRTAREHVLHPLPPTNPHRHHSDRPDAGSRLLDDNEGAFGSPLKQRESEGGELNVSTPERNNSSAAAGNNLNILDGSGSQQQQQHEGGFSLSQLVCPTQLSQQFAQANALLLGSGGGDPLPQDSSSSGAAAGGGEEAGSVTFGPAGSETSLNLDAIFANPIPNFPLRGILGHPLPMIEKKQTHARTCCYAFLFKEHTNMQKITEILREKVGLTQRLYNASSSRSVSLQKQPSYFFTSPDLIWLVYNASSTSMERWLSHGQTLQCHFHRVISSHASVPNGTRGMEHVVAHFGLNREERDTLYLSASMDIGFIKHEVNRPSRKRLALRGARVVRKTTRHARQVKPRVFKGGKGRAAVEEDHREDQYDDGADSGGGGGGCSRHDNSDDKGRKATRPEPKEQGQQRWMMKRSLQQQNSAGEGRAAKTPRVMRALPATTEGEQDHHGSGGQSLPVVRSLTGAFRDQPPASPHQGKRPQDSSSIHSPSRDSTKGRGAAAVGPSPRKGRAQGRLPAMATILQDSIVDSLIRYLANKENFVSTPDILAEFKRFTERSNIGASALANTAVVTGDSAFEALKMLITLQSLMADTVRKQYLIPVENLTPNGLLPNHHSWSTLKANNPEGHRYITEILDNINTTTTAAFEKGSLLFDPVSIAFFVAIQTLHVQFDKQAARAPFLEFTCQGLALVSPHPSPLLF